MIEDENLIHANQLEVIVASAPNLGSLTFKGKFSFKIEDFGYIKKPSHSLTHLDCMAIDKPNVNPMEIDDTSVTDRM